MKPSRFTSASPTAARLVALLLLGSADARADAPPTFERDIRPILKAHCFDCHGEDGRREGGLDLRLRRLMVAGGDEGPAIHPGQPADSRLLRLVESGEMPRRDRKLTPDQVAMIRDWIAAGAPTARPEPEIAPEQTGLTEEERSFWAFQPIQRPAIPSPPAGQPIRTPVDAFLAIAQAGRGLRFSADADRGTLIRRVHLDLTGLPPTPEEAAAFRADPAPDAYERMVDRVLESVHYGERWARHWLDVAGYADSDGYSDADPPRAHAYKYRDYVIRAFNADMPLDRFVTEQLAGDELAGVTRDTAPAAASADPAIRDLLAATGFLRTGADGSATPALADPDAVRNQVVADTLRIVSTSLLGLSVGCAQCHDHRYDPIPQADYYRLRAVFEPALDWKNWRTPAQRLVSLHTEAERAMAEAVEAEARQLAAEREARQKEFLAAALAKHLEKFDPELRGRLREAVDTPADQRSEGQKQLLREHPSVNIHPGVLYQYDSKAAEELKAMDARIADVRARRPAEDFIAALTEPTDHHPPTHLFHRGDHRQPRAVVRPGGLSVLGDGGNPAEFPEDTPDVPTTGRRLAFARWLTAGTNPLPARVLVNRVWMHHFGRGLVDTPGDFGAMGERPTHPELLDWLAADLMDNGWRLKRLHRLILTSTAYRQASARHPDGEMADRDNHLFWRAPVRRLDAEALRDSVLAVAGTLDRRLFGPPTPVRADVHGQIIEGEERTVGDNRMPVDVPPTGDLYRRSVYIQVRRSRPLAFLHAFDAPVMEVNCERRQNSTVATQSLMLMNSGFLLDQSSHFAGRLLREVGEDPAALVRRAWQLAFQRDPRPREVADALAFLREQTAAHAAGPVSSDVPPSARLALTHLCQALLSANEFLHVD